MHDATCPSVAHVLDRIDGGLARVRFPGGRLSAAQLRAVAATADRFGNGTIEITNRANLQVRGLPAGAVPAVAEILMAAGASMGAAGDLRRNVLAGPMAGLDPTELADTWPVVTAIVECLAADPPLGGLAPKAGVVVDGGGAWHLGGRRDDVVVTAVAGDRFELRAGGADGVVSCGAEDVPEEVRRALEATLAGGGARLLAEVPPPSGAPSSVTVGPLGVGPLGPADAGMSGTFGGGTWVGGMPPLGRMGPSAAAAVADLAEQFGDGAVRLTPWRGLVLAGVSRSVAGTVAGALQHAGMLIDPADPKVAVVACAGSHGCTSGHTDAPADALAVAAARRAAGREPLAVHVSACPKRCAQRAPAAVTLVGGPDGCYEVWIADPDAEGGERLLAPGLAPATAIQAAGGLE